MKPQYLPVYVIVLLLGRSWRSAAAAVLGGIVVGLSPVAAGGIDGLSAMISNALEPGQSYLRYSESLVGSLAPFVGGSTASVIGFAMWGLVLAGLAFFAMRAPSPTLPSGSKAMTRRAKAIATVATVAGVLFAPHALPYDLVLLAVPMWLAADLEIRREIPTPAPAGFAIAAAMVLDLGRPTISLTPLVMLGCLAIYAVIWFRRRNGTARQLSRVA
jgi:hypothetical protein